MRDADNAGSLLSRIRTMLKLTPEEMIGPAMKKAVDEVATVPKLQKPIEGLDGELDLTQKLLGTEQEKVKGLEQEIGPLRRLKALTLELIPRLIEPKTHTRNWPTA